MVVVVVVVVVIIGSRGKLQHEHVQWICSGFQCHCVVSAALGFGSGSCSVCGLRQSTLTLAASTFEVLLIEVLNMFVHTHRLKRDRPAIFTAAKYSRRPSSSSSSSSALFFPLVNDIFSCCFCFPAPHTTTPPVAALGSLSEREFLLVV